MGRNGYRALLGAPREEWMSAHKSNYNKKQRKKRLPRDRFTHIYTETSSRCAPKAVASIYGRRMQNADIRLDAMSDAHPLIGGV